MKTRLLPHAERGKLAGTELETAAEFFPVDSRIIVVEDGDAIVGCWGLPRYLHCECLWIRPSHRPIGLGMGVVGELLVSRMQQEARQTGDRVVLTHALEAGIARWCQRMHGKPLPGTAYVLPIGDA